MDGGSARDGGTFAYEITDLGPVVEVSSIDGRGRVAGYVPMNLGADHAGAVYTPGSGWSAIPVPEGAAYAVAIGIDSNGNVGLNALFREGCIKCSIQHSYLAYPLRPVPFARQDFQTSLINAMHPVTGHVVGYDEALGGAYLHDGAVTPIAVQPGKSYDNEGPSQATALNVHDQVAGWMRLGADSTPYNGTSKHAFLWDQGKVTLLETAGQCDSEAVGINDHGVIVGMIDVGQRCGEPRVFLWDGQMHVVGCPSGAMVCSPFGINARGDVVGQSLIDFATGERAFIYRDGVFHLLDYLLDATGWKLEMARAINDAGQITGWGTVNGQPRGFVLTPR